MTEIKGELLSLKDTQLETENPAEDIRKHDVVDSAGEKVGHVSDLLVDDGERKVRLMEVAHGGLLGIGQEKVLIPVDAITKIDADVVHIDRSREHVAGAPVLRSGRGTSAGRLRRSLRLLWLCAVLGPGIRLPGQSETLRTRPRMQQRKPRPLKSLF